MTLSKRITARGTNVFLLASVILICVLLNSAVAQSGYNYHDTHHPVKQVKTASGKINYAENVNLEAKAVALSNAFNSPYDDIKPSLTPCGKRLYFSRHLHPANTFGTIDLEDIWFADFDDETQTWSEPARLSGELNNAGPNYVNNVSVTGDTIILGNRYKRNGKMVAGVSYSVNVDGKWSFPQSINILNDYNISEQSNTFVSLKNGIIIRAVQRLETEGLRDLYVSFWNGYEATEPINMGTVINTEFEESSPFLASDNKTLYFASKGHTGLGGSDIFVTRRLDDTWTNWSTPENLGPAVNGPMDDEFFSISHCGNFAVFSKQVNVHNTDLYRISLKELFGTPDAVKQAPVKQQRHESNENSETTRIAFAAL
jgi:OmpA-OmpF porin, OOP family